MNDKRDDILCPLDSLYDDRLRNKWKVFLMGPILGADSWQNAVPQLSGVVYFSPRRPVSSGAFDYDCQVDWETKAIKMANVVLCWIPEAIEQIEGRQYAQTTRFEIGEYLARGKKMIIGINNKFPGRRYIVGKKYSNILAPICDTLEGCVDALVSYICNHKQQIWFTSDTHFGSERALNLSKRPFYSVEDMDWTMIERWNNNVAPNDPVFHLGDFGDTGVLNYLTGKISIMPGNYERAGNTDLSMFDNVMSSPIAPLRIIRKDSGVVTIEMCHEPITAKNAFDVGRPFGEKRYFLFGHIHGRQMIKKFGIDVGVDCHNYAPVEFEALEFYLNAIDKGYYDENVFC